MLPDELWILDKDYLQAWNTEKSIQIMNLYDVTHDNMHVNQSVK